MKKLKPQFTRMSEDMYGKKIVERHMISVRGDNLLEQIFLHREDGPAEIEYYVNHTVTDFKKMSRREKYIVKKKWYQFGYLHRADGPAIIVFDSTGKAVTKLWYLDGKMIEVYSWLEENNIKWPFNEEEELLFKMSFL